MCMTDKQWSVRTMECVPWDGKCSRGWEKVGSDEGIKKFASMKWNLLVQERVNRRSLGEAFILQ